ncbi:AmiS/UreI family transporter [Mesobacillus zeae]|uniref:Acetamide transporter n=1 Tax=Mesobacillus zeae TaxID=1917180 RepID=A0A398B6I9_9BACI|nr:AmiS/UreI family transporter [Mesobacillus zeae]RID83303.1 acetamide transporter [Mesobacillus zeae]
MGDAGLLISGAALFLNSLMLLGKAEEKSVAVFNIFAGFLQVAVPFYLIAVSDQQNWTIYSLATIFLFGFTYLYVGFTLFKGLDGTGLGWYSLWVSIIAVIYAVVSAVHFHDMVNTLTWIMWAFLWFLFFLSMGLGKKIDKYVGRVAFIQSWITLTFPSLLSMTGVWKSPEVITIWIWVSALAISYFIFSAIRFRFIKVTSSQPVLSDD